MCTALVLVGIYHETTALNNGVALTPPSKTNQVSVIME